MHWQVKNVEYCSLEENMYAAPPIWHIPVYIAYVDQKWLLVVGEQVSIVRKNDIP
jgi:hypothetical protein